MSPNSELGCSAVMVSYHTGPALWRALDAALSAPGVDEVVLVDNGNPDDVRAQLAARAAQTPRLVLVTPAGNAGFGAGCNAGAAVARGRLLLFVNPDAELPAGAVRDLAAVAADAPSPCIVGARLVGLDGAEQRGPRRAVLTPARALAAMTGLERLGIFRFHLDAAPGQAAPEAPVPVGAVSGACFLMRAVDFHTLGGFDVGYFLHVEDIDLCRRALEAGGSVLLAPGVTVVHEGGTSAAGAFRLAAAKSASFARYFRKFARTPEQRLAAWCIMPLLVTAIYARALIHRITRA